MNEAQFVDASGTTRFEGSIEYPGATPGDVLEVGSGGTISPQTPGGGSAISMASVNVSAADILALHTTAKELLPAPGGRLYYVVHGLVAHYRFVTTPYDPVDSRHLQVGYGTVIATISNATAVIVFSGSTPDFTGQNFLQQTADAYEVYAGAEVFIASGGYTNWLAPAIENQPLSLVTDGAAFTGGDSTLTIRLFYSTINGAP